MIHTIYFRIFLRVSFAITCVVGLLMPAISRAATADLQVRLDDCSGNHYPRITCTVAVRDETGQPIEGLDARAFQVAFDEAIVTAPSITPIIDDASNSHVMVVLDDGLTNRVRYGRSWHTAADAVLAQLPQGHGATLLSASQSHSLVWMPTHTTPSDVQHMRETVQSQKLMLHAQLFDVLCDAAAQVPHAERASVWIAVVSDGLDRGSTVCTEDEAVQAIGRARVPVLVVGVGAYAGNLKRIAAASHGMYVDAADTEAVRNGVDEVMHRARLRYAVEFATTLPADGHEHAVAVTVRRAGGESHDATGVEALPLAPSLLGLNFASDGMTLSASTLPARGRIRVEPRFVAQGASVAEFVLDGMHARVDVPPYAFEFDGSVLPADRPSVLSVTVYGPAGEASVGSTQIVQIAPEGSAAAWQIDPSGAGAHAWVAGSVGSLAAGTGLALLLGGVVATIGWRPQKMHLQKLLAHLRNSPEAAVPVAMRFDAYDEPTLRRSMERMTAPVGAVNRLCLRIRAPGAPVRDIEVSRTSVLGRATSGVHPEIAITSSYLSLRHARFEMKDGAWHVVDLHSVNGVRRNGNPLGSGAYERIAIGDRIACADVLVEVVGISVGGVDGGEVG